MDIHAISRGIAFYFILIFIAISTLNFYDFSITEKQFTTFLVLGIFSVGLYTGKRAKEFSSLNGFLIGLVTAIFLVFLISPYTDMKWELNFLIMVVWVSVSVGGAFIGGRVDKFLERRFTKKQLA